jgi:hypothetical protein
VTGFLEISDAEVDYFDPFLDARLEGLSALRAYYEGMQGKIQLDRWEIVNPRVLVAADMAVLTFNFVSQSQERVMRWNTTEVYGRKNGQWKIVHTHWALTQAH